MTPLAYLQNALLLATAVGIYLWAGTAWGFFLLLGWLSPSSKCECPDGEDDDAPRIVTK